MRECANLSILRSKWWRLATKTDLTKRLCRFCRLAPLRRNGNLPHKAAIFASQMRTHFCAYRNIIEFYAFLRAQNGFACLLQSKRGAMRHFSALLRGGRTGICRTRRQYSLARMRTRVCAHGAQTGALRACSKAKGVPCGTPFALEQATGIEPASPAWEAGVLPLDYACGLSYYI